VLKRPLSQSSLIEENEGRKERREKGEIRLIPLWERLVTELCSIKNFYLLSLFISVLG